MTKYISNSNTSGVLDFQFIYLYIAVLILAAGTIVAPDNVQAHDQPEQIRVIASEANIHSEAGSIHPVILTVEMETILTVLESVGNWYRVQLTPEMGAHQESGFIYNTVAAPVGQTPATSVEPPQQPLETQQEDTDQNFQLPPPRVTGYVGIGTSLGWFGLQGEMYLLDGHFSLFGGLGRAPEDFPFSGGLAYAIGGRLYVDSSNRRLFGEASYSLLVVEGISLDDDNMYYGPGGQIGYQFISDGQIAILDNQIPAGITFSVSAGVGFADLPDRLDSSNTQFIFGLALGYTLR